MSKRNQIGVREDRCTGQFIPTVDGVDVSPTSFDRQRALEIAALASIPTMESEDESAALAEALRQRTAERDALAERLKQTPAMREVIRELVAVLVEIQDRQNDIAEMRLKELIRRMDRERE